MWIHILTEYLSRSFSSPHKTAGRGIKPSQISIKHHGFNLFDALYNFSMKLILSRVKVFAVIRYQFLSIRQGNNYTPHVQRT